MPSIASPTVLNPNSTLSNNNSHPSRFPVPVLGFTQKLGIELHNTGSAFFGMGRWTGNRGNLLYSTLNSCSLLHMTYYSGNRSLLHAIECRRPKETWSNELVDYTGLRIFDFLAYAHVSEGMLEQRRRRWCIFVGYAQEVKGTHALVP